MVGRARGAGRPGEGRPRRSPARDPALDPAWRDHLRTAIRGTLAAGGTVFVLFPRALVCGTPRGSLRPPRPRRRPGGRSPPGPLAPPPPGQTLRGTRATPGRPLP